MLATIKPAHSLVAALLQDIAQPELLLDGYASPHTFQLRPGDADKISRADIVVWVGPTMETALRNILARGERRGQLVIRLMDDAESAAAERHDDHGEDRHDHDEDRHGKDDDDGHGDDHDHHDEHRDGHDEDRHGHDDDHGEHHDEHHDDADGDAHTHLHEDPHRWLDPVLAAADMERVAAAIGAKHPELQTRLDRNLRRLQKRLGRLDRDIRARLAGRAVIPALAYHDAWGYFQSRYGIKLHGIMNPGAHGQPTARRLHALGEAVKTKQTRCMLIEPQFKPRYIAPFVREHGLDTVTLDPLGAELGRGPDLYFQLMRAVADGLGRCR